AVDPGGQQVSGGHDESLETIDPDEDVLLCPCDVFHDRPSDSRLRFGAARAQAGRVHVVNMWGEETTVSVGYRVSRSFPGAHDQGDHRNRSPGPYRRKAQRETGQV